MVDIYLLPSTFPTNDYPQVLSPLTTALDKARPLNYNSLSAYFIYNSRISINSIKLRATL
ncbi:MAG: hypothetical protein JWP00_2446 [Chloroflexi bacterium]|nr:hypothetical protein [Chloroflexota bacterium]